MIAQNAVRHRIAVLVVLDSVHIVGIEVNGLIRDAVRFDNLQIKFDVLVFEIRILRQDNESLAVLTSCHAYKPEFYRF